MKVNLTTLIVSTVLASSAATADGSNPRIVWDIDAQDGLSELDKKVLKRGALRVLNDEPTCQKIGSGYRSGVTKGSYYVTCVAGDGSFFNVRFMPRDLDSSAPIIRRK